MEYLRWVRDRFARDPALRDHAWFALAGYNAGIGHVADARRLARDQGWDENRWFGEVEKAMLLLAEPRYANQAGHGYVRGREPVRYVREIRDRYRAYLALTDEATSAEGLSGQASSGHGQVVFEEGLEGREGGAGEEDSAVHEADGAGDVAPEGLRAGQTGEPAVGPEGLGQALDGGPPEPLGVA